MFKSYCFLLLAFCVSIAGFSQKKSAKMVNAPKSVSPVSDSAYYATTKFRLVGPFRGGRSGAVAGSYKNRNEFYFGATGGGVWKTTDGGSNWKNISDKYFGGSIGAVALAKSNEKIMYVGEGESTLRSNVSEGLNGLWKSDDGGRSWKNMGLKDSRHIVRIVIHPDNPDVVVVAVMGHLFGPSASKGIYKTVDGGKTWKHVLYVSDSVGCGDITMVPGELNIIYAGMWNVRRTPYSLESGGPGSGLYKSTDGGDTWQSISISPGLPKGMWGAVNVAVAPSNPEKVFALIENENGGLFVSNDGGQNWSVATRDNEVRQRAWYFNQVIVDPKNENIVYCLNVNMMKSVDGGKSFKAIGTPHPDHHGMWIDPEDADRMIIADDGGAQVSFDKGANWSTYYNQPTAQIYRVSTNNAFPYHILGAQQDNSTIRIKSRTYGGGVTERDWESTAGFESGYVVADPQNPDIVYGGNYGGYLSRLDHHTGESRAVNVWPDQPIGAGADAQKYRFQWNFPIFFSPNNPKRMYAAGNNLFVTEDEGQSWTIISPDLTTNDTSKQKPSGGPITKDNTTAEYYCTIFTAAESAIEPGLLWTGSDDGLVHVSKDNGKHWENVTPPLAGKWMMWNCVDVDPFKRGTAYFAGTKYKMDDFSPYLFMTEDYGKTWKQITAGIDKMHFTRVVRADKKVPGLLYVGTEYGMYISYNGGAKWEKWQLNLPMVPITDLSIKNNDLVVATQGRAFWVVDDLTLVQKHKDVKDSLNNKKLYVFPVNETFRMHGYVDSNIKNGGINPPNGVVINYYVSGSVDGNAVWVTIYNKEHKLVKSFSSRGKPGVNDLEYKNGMNRFVWDMNYEPADKIEGMVLWNGTPGGPKAAPGTYYAKVKFETDSAEVKFEVKGDPNYKVSNEEYEEQVTFCLKVRDKFNETQATIKNIRTLRGQISDLMGRIDTGFAQKLKDRVDTINKRMTQIEEDLYQTKAKAGEDILNYPMKLNDRMAALYNVASSGFHAPTRQVTQAYEELCVPVDKLIKQFKQLVENDVAKLNDAINSGRVPVIGVRK